MPISLQKKQKLFPCFIAFCNLFCSVQSRSTFVFCWYRHRHKVHRFFFFTVGIQFLACPFCILILSDPNKPPSLSTMNTAWIVEHALQVCLALFLVFLGGGSYYAIGWKNARGRTRSARRVRPRSPGRVLQVPGAAHSYPPRLLSEWYVFQLDSRRMTFFCTCCFVSEFFSFLRWQ